MKKEHLSKRNTRKPLEKHLIDLSPPSLIWDSSYTDVVVRKTTDTAMLAVRLFERLFTKDLSRFTFSHKNMELSSET